MRDSETVIQNGVENCEKLHKLSQEKSLDSENGIRIIRTKKSLSWTTSTDKEAVAKQSDSKIAV